MFPEETQNSTGLECHSTERFFWAKFGKAGSANNSLGMDLVGKLPRFPLNWETGLFNKHFHNKLQAIPATTFGLGCWQVQRKRWKENLIVDLEQKAKQPPAELPEK